MLDRIDGLVKWYRFEKLLSALRAEGPGRPAWPPLMMFRALLLQSLYGLSDAETEEALADRLTFRRFVGLGLADAMPDHSTICSFRNLPLERGLLEKLFAELDRQLDKAGLILRRGTMLDATVIESSAAGPRDGRPSSDPDARFTRRQGRQGSSFGYKAHVGVDEGSDTVPADALICGDERAVLADAAYHTHTREAALRARGIKPRLMRRPNKHHPLLPPRLRRYNRLLARRRAPVETAFATMKRRMGLTLIRYRGLAKASAQVLVAAFAFSLRRWAALSSAGPRPESARSRLQTANPSPKSPENTARRGETPARPPSAAPTRFMQRSL